MVLLYQFASMWWTEDPNPTPPKVKKPTDSISSSSPTSLALAQVARNLKRNLAMFLAKNATAQPGATWPCFWSNLAQPSHDLTATVQKGQTLQNETINK